MILNGDDYNTGCGGSDDHTKLKGQQYFSLVNGPLRTPTEQFEVL